jgi:hypothetical protein
MALRCIAAVSLLAFGDAASYASIAGYEPGSDVVPHNRIDLDQKDMELHLDKTIPEFTKATEIYEKGANSGAYARLTVNATSKVMAKGTAVTGTSSAGAGKATGAVKKDTAKGAVTVDVTYSSTCVDNAASAAYSISGCFTTGGPVTPDIGTPLAVQNKYRTLKGFSTAAGEKMQGQATFEKFKKYYGRSDYGDAYVTDALAGSGNFTNADPVARAECAKKASAYMNVWMYVIREFEDGEADCKGGCSVACNDDPVHAWDEGVAFYTGTLEGVDGKGSGKLLHALADKRCANFKTCDDNGLSEVNKEIFKEFTNGNNALRSGKCTAVAAIRDSIIKWMTVPLIQGALRYAYKVNKLQGGAKEKAEGAIFAAAVLPLVHACNAPAATLIHKNMVINSAAPMADGFAKVKEAFESTYACLKITCANVGGLVVTGDTYYEGAGPCGVTDQNVGAASGASDTACSMVLILFAMVANVCALAAY